VFQKRIRKGDGVFIRDQCCRFYLHIGESSPHFAKESPVPWRSGNLSRSGIVGPQFHWDYYNSFVIHPMLLEVLTTVSKQSKAWEPFEPAILTRAQRYAAIQERMIGPDGSYPAIGRSLAYRFGAFHLLATMALRRQLPSGVKPEQVRCAMTAVIRRMIEASGTFDKQGWLTVGFCGHQPSVGENYISTGSLYLCSAALLPLGLSSADQFWSAPRQPWTSQKIWNGEDIPADHAI
jgi:hypothetical protein